MVATKHRPLAPVVTLIVDPEPAAIAIQRDSSHCMWADAVSRAVPTATKVAVDLQTIRFTDPAKGLRYTYLTPRRAQLSLVQFDAGIYPQTLMRVTLRNGQVTKAHNYAKVRRKPGEGTIPDGKAGLRNRSPGSVPDVVGGQPPPTAALANTAYRGRRRAFGLRGLI